jgi:hypothetical protein
MAVEMTSIQTVSCGSKEKPIRNVKKNLIVITIVYVNYRRRWTKIEMEEWLKMTFYLYAEDI